MDDSKTVHTIVLDAGPILKNDPAVSSLLARCETLVTVPSVISEIKDATARARVETLLLPFLTLRSPAPGSVKVISDFARRTGDLAVLSKPDIKILALAYEIECERNGGDWRLRRVPGQKGLNGAPPKKHESIPQTSDHADPATGTAADSEDNASNELAPFVVPESAAATSQRSAKAEQSRGYSESAEPFGKTSESLNSLCIADNGRRDTTTVTMGSSHPPAHTSQEFLSLSRSGSEESEDWITSSNLRKHQAKDSNTSALLVLETGITQVATITTDFAMQNVLLQMNLNLLSTSLQRVRNLKTYILRCHACFDQTKDMTKQFCPRCGKPTLTRVACSTNQHGEFKIHLKKKMQWNTRGDRFSIPKPVSGAANGKVGTRKGGGKGGWGQELILAEDQKEYLRSIQGQSRKKEKDLMDEDYLPSILTGERGRAGGRPKIGAGRNVNSKKR
ncbi:Nin one binding (NOB1) Zn-ribbon-like [Lasallia pustulata]|uniref:20S-pre-rRNA D-site endonuclease NOB1 n=1 Tax=Lasallia pustulata TaxID=136370 RepID=A0A1W5D4M2_9LECA|nr:Nin one binding (NOB1) Zn-ribbon-like [Lasallia pustulata]